GGEAPPATRDRPTRGQTVAGRRARRTGPRGQARDHHIRPRHIDAFFGSRPTCGAVPVEISRHELNTLNFYRASELHGGLILGHLVARAREQSLIHNLTRHSAESLVHAQIWSETILALGGELQPIQATYQRRFSEIA